MLIFQSITLVPKIVKIKNKKRAYCSLNSFHTAHVWGRREGIFDSVMALGQTCQARNKNLTSVLSLPHI